MMELSPARVVSLLVLVTAVLISSCLARSAVGRGQLEMTLRELKATNAEIATLKETISGLQKKCPTIREETTTPQPEATDPPKPETNTPQPETTDPPKPETTTTRPGKNMTMPFMPYDFDWGVRNEMSGNIFSHSEKSEGNDVRGEYSVLLPDGRTQVVTYWADNDSGYNAKVTFEKKNDRTQI